MMEYKVIKNVSIRRITKHESDIIVFNIQQMSVLTTKNLIIERRV